MQSNFLKIIIGILCAVCSISAFSQDDVTPKGLFPQVTTLSATELSDTDIIYEAQASDIAASWSLQGWSLQADKRVVSTGAYAANATVSMQSAAITVPDISSGEEVILYITEAFSIENEYDAGSIQISDDGGNSWKRVITIDGQTDMRTNSINVSRYAGKSIIVKLTLTSDASIESSGWDVRKILLQKGTLVSNPSSLKTGSQSLLKAGGPNPAINVLAVHDANFPDAVFVDFEYTEDGVFIDDLTKGMLDISENGIDQADGCFKLWRESQNRPLDIVFMIDNSGSMDDEQAAVIANIDALTAELDSLSFDTQYAYMRFGQSANGGYPQIEDVTTLPPFVWTGDQQEFSDAMLDLSTVDGGFEPGYDALVKGSTMNFRANAEKVFVIVTDENTTIPPGNNEGAHSQLDALNAVAGGNIRVFGVLPTDTEYDATYGTVIDDSNGDRYDIASDFGPALVSELTNTLASKYTLRYCPIDKTTFDVERIVDLSLTSDPSAHDTGSYTPLINQRYIVRDSTAKSYDYMPQQQNVELLIDVIITDHAAPYPTDVTLYYADLGQNTPYSSVNMVSDNATSWPNKRFTANIPAHRAVTPGLKYYVVAEYADGSTIKTPTSKSDFFAWTIAVLPNEPPQITEMSHSPLVLNQDLTVVYEVTDITIEVSTIDFYYRELNSPSSFVKIPVAIASGTGGIWASTIPASYCGGQGIEYFIRATDNYGAASLYGTPQQPNVLEFDISTIDIVTPTSKSMDLGLANTTFTCNDLLVGDRLALYFMNDNGILQAAGEHIVVQNEQYWISHFTVYGDDSGNNPKNGFAEGEELVLIHERAGVQTIMTLDNPVTYETNSWKQIDNAFANEKPIIVIHDEDWTDIIENGDLISDTYDGTDFGSSINPVTHTFKIENAGCRDVEISTISLTNTSAFTTNAAVPITLVQGGQQVFSVTYDASSDATSAVKIHSNADAYPYIFAIQGKKTDNSTIGINPYITPNPMNTWGGNLHFTLPSPDFVTVQIFDINGNLQLTPATNQEFYGDGNQESSLWIDGWALPAGTYIIEISTASNIQESITILKN
ncbi:MAG: T9SS type A sorting domain-containing protein [Bacteroidales bacterium]|jgi:hypothetical protein|nr:T9SS type A sorting domain-containing protein [Bacteroidales bacterium]